MREIPDDVDRRLRDAIRDLNRATDVLGDVVGVSTGPRPPHGEVPLQPVDVGAVEQAQADERAARVEYAAALKAAGWNPPTGLLHDVPEDERP